VHVLKDDVARQLVEFVRGGGVLLADCRTAVKDETNLAYDRTLPGLLSPALGIEIGEYESLRLGISDDETTSYQIQTSDPLSGDFTALHFADWITPATAKAVARYDQPHLKEFAAVTRNEFGEGVGWYVGTIIEQSEFYDQLMANVLKDANIRPLGKPPAGVELAQRKSAERELLFVINHTADNQTIDVPANEQELLSDETTDRTLNLGPFGVAVIELPGSDLRRDE
jgi:beta-galactosidase